MKHTLQIRVSKKPVNSGAVSVRKCVCAGAVHAFPAGGQGQADGHCSRQHGGGTLDPGGCRRRAGA